jgi:ComEC/Rec2-related protein
LSGIASAYYLSWPALPAGIGLAAALVVFLAAAGSGRPWALHILCAAFFALGAFLFPLQFHTDFSGIDEGADYRVRGRVADRQLGASNRYTLDRVTLTSGDEATEFGKNVYLYSGELLSYGDVVEFDTAVEQPSAPRNPGALDLRMYLASAGVGFSCYEEEVVRVGERPGAYGAFLFLRETIAEKIDDYFTEETAPVAKAMFLGIKNQIPDELREEYGATGISHVLAISGLHITIIAAAAAWLLGRMRLPRNLRFPLSIGLLVFYAMLTGLAPSVVRAVAMSSLMLLGRWKFTGRDSLTFLAAALLGTLVFNTAQLFIPGVLLSYGVVFGLLCLMPPLNALWERLGFSNRFTQSLGTSGAASLAGFPLTSYFFGTFPLAAPLANFYAIPLTTIIVVCTGLFAVLSFIPPVASVLAVPPQIAAGLLNWFNSLFAGTGFGNVRAVHFPVVAVFPVFAMVFVCSDCVMIRRKWKAVLCCVLAGLTAVFWAAAYAGQEAYRLKMTVLDVGTGDIVHIRTGGGDYLVDIHYMRYTREIRGFCQTFVRH